MPDDMIGDTAKRAALRRNALLETTKQIRRRMDPRLVAADLARLVMARAVARATGITTTPERRKRAIIGAGVAAAFAVGLRVLYRNASEKPSPEIPKDANSPG